MAPHWRTAFEAELQQGWAARSRGNEGMARVCARRAAGIVIGEYLNRQGLSHASPSAYARLQWLIAQPATSPQVKEIAAHFLMPVSTDHTLPIQADLLAEAHWLAETLLKGE